MPGRAVNGAKAVKGTPAKPSDNKTKALCPCETFERCMKRQPYGADVWSGPKKKEAMDCIAYSVKGVISDSEIKKKAQERLSYFLENRKNPFYANLRGLLKNQGKPRVLVFPEIKNAYISAQMGILAADLYNTADFTNFQKSMILRANLVRNGTVMRADLYGDAREGFSFGRKTLLPYCGEYTAKMWSVDHVNIRSKGGCNRFCNAAVLALYDNSTVKNDSGPGCPCVCPIDKKNGETPGDGQKPFEIKKGKQKRYKLYECTDYFLARKNKAQGLPGKPCGICAASRACNLDDPRKCAAPRSGAAMIKPVYKPE